MQIGSFLSGPRVSSQSIFAKGLKWAALAEGHPLEVRGPSFAGPSLKALRHWQPFLLGLTREAAQRQYASVLSEGSGG